MDSKLEKQRRLHFDLINVGLRAQATAAGLVRLCIELRDTGVLSQDALERIKGAIADDVSLTAPRGLSARASRRARSAEGSVGKECVSKCRSRGWAGHKKKNNQRHHVLC